MATQTINYLRQIDQIDGPVAEHKTVDRASQIIREGLIGPSRWAEQARRLIAAHSANDKTVIFEGEPGTGKRLLARLIHQCSGYSQGPFVSVALGSTTDEVARSVLFGPPRTQVDDLPGSEKGLIGLAVGGTLYIDGLLDTSPGLICDVARFIDDAGLNRKGDGSVRIVLGSTNHFGYQSRTSISRAQGISGERIQIPPLRERPDDIEALAAHFVKQRCEQLRKELRAISQSAVSALINYDWPRNVAELRLVVNHLVRQSGPPSLDVALLPAYMQGPGDSEKTLAAFELDLDEEVKQFEINLICAALRRSRGLQNKAALLLRIRPTTLFMKIKRYGIEVADFRSPAEKSRASCFRTSEETD
jgi:DNA-binding NtrC family response regulator